MDTLKPLLAVILFLLLSVWPATAQLPHWRKVFLAKEDSLLTEMQSLKYTYEQRLGALYEALQAAKEDESLPAAERAKCYEIEGTLLLPNILQGHADRLSERATPASLAIQGHAYPHYRALQRAAEESYIDGWHLMPYLLKSFAQQRGEEHFRLAHSLMRPVWGMGPERLAIVMAQLAKGAQGEERDGILAFSAYLEGLE